jgi:Tol biopolymer transport system component
LSLRAFAVAIVIATAALAFAVPGRAGSAPETNRVSVDSSGAQATGGASYRPALSASGRFVAFYSSATDLVSGDTNGQPDVFVRDLKTGKTKRVSVDSSGAQALGGASYNPSISADGRFVAFDSGANLVGGDSNGQTDVFVRDLEKHTTKRVSVDSSGVQALGGGSYRPSISADGRFIAFSSDATNLVGGDSNGLTDVFVRDLKTGKTKRVSVNSSGAQALGGGSYSPSISADGHLVAFYSDATNLVGGDSNALTDVFVRDLAKHKTKRINVNSSGAQALGNASYNPSISADGRFVTFQSYANNLVPDDTNAVGDIFLRDLKTHKTTRVSVTSHGDQANDSSFFVDPAISANGRFVTFISVATNLSPQATDTYEDDFVHDRKTGKTKLLSVNDAGLDGNSYSFDPAISADGRWVAFPSDATNLVGGDTNTYSDIFVRGPLR